MVYVFYIEIEKIKLFRKFYAKWGMKIVDQKNDYHRR